MTEFFCIGIYYLHIIIGDYLLFSEPVLFPDDLDVAEADDLDVAEAEDLDFDLALEDFFFFFPDCVFVDEPDDSSSDSLRARFPVVATPGVGVLGSIGITLGIGITSSSECGASSGLMSSSGMRPTSFACWS